MPRVIPRNRTIRITARLAPGLLVLLVLLCGTVALIEAGKNDQKNRSGTFVAFYADNQCDNDQEDAVHAIAVKRILATGADPVIHAGDLLEDGTRDSMERFDRIAADLLSSRTFYGALGNNDRSTNDYSPSRIYLDRFQFPGNERWYSVDTGDLHLVVLDSAFSSTNQEQIRWLISDLQSGNARSRITAVVFHHPDFRHKIAPILEENGVEFVVNGHIHQYTHHAENGVHYFTTTGMPSPGYLTARIGKDNVRIMSYDANNELKESIIIKKR